MLGRCQAPAPAAVQLRRASLQGGGARWVPHVGSRLGRGCHYIISISYIGFVKFYKAVHGRPGRVVFKAAAACRCCCCRCLADGSSVYRRSVRAQRSLHLQPASRSRRGGQATRRGDSQQPAMHVLVLLPPPHRTCLRRRLPPLRPTRPPPLAAQAQLAERSPIAAAAAAPAPSHTPLQPVPCLFWWRCCSPLVWMLPLWRQFSRQLGPSPTWRWSVFLSFPVLCSYLQRSACWGRCHLLTPVLPQYCPSRPP